MRHTLLFLIVAALIGVASIGCQSDAEKYVSLTEEMAEIVDENKDDCDAMAENLRSFWSENGGEIKSLQEKLGDEFSGTEEQKNRMEDAQAKLMGLLGCALSSEDVQDVLNEME